MRTWNPRPEVCYCVARYGFQARPSEARGRRCDKVMGNAHDDQRSDRIRAVQELAFLDRRRDGADDLPDDLFGCAEGQYGLLDRDVRRVGEVGGQGLTLPGHLGSMPTAMAAIRKAFDGKIESSDVFILNDPFQGGMHLPDIFVFKPIFSGRGLLAWAGTVCHHTDVGGRVPGSNASDSTEIYQ